MRIDVAVARSGAARGNHGTKTSPLVVVNPDSNLSGPYRVGLAVEPNAARESNPPASG